SPDEPRYIETLPRLGYRFIGPVEIVAAPLSSLVVAGPASNQELQETTKTAGVDFVEPGRAAPAGRPKVWSVPLALKLVAASGLVLAVMLGALALHSGVFAKRSGESRIHSIAVLPLQNLSGDPSEDYFSDGMTDALITNLAQSESLQVI